MAEQVHTTYALEIEIDLTGTYFPGTPERGPTYDCGGEPADPPSIENTDISAVRYERLSFKGLKALRKTIITRVDLIKGLDKAARDIITANLLEAMGEDAESALMDEVGRYS